MADMDDLSERIARLEYKDANLRSRVMMLENSKHNPLRGASVLRRLVWLMHGLTEKGIDEVNDLEARMKVVRKALS